MTAIANCPRCGRVAPYDPFEDPHCQSCRAVLELVRWLCALRDELVDFAAAELTHMAAESPGTNDSLDAQRRRLHEWLLTAESTLRERGVGGPLVRNLAVPVLAAPRTREAIETINFVIREVYAPSDSGRPI